MKMKSKINVTMPMTQEIEIVHRHDKEWQTNFVTLYVTELGPNRDRPFSEEMSICFNTKKDFKTFIAHLRQLEKKMK